MKFEVNAMALVIPQVNSNGNRKLELVEQLEQAHDALSKAIDALENCEHSNLRNFQTHKGGMQAGQECRRQHAEWIQQVKDVKLGVMTVAYEVSQQ